MQLDEARQLLSEHIRRLGLKHSTQRETILRIFLRTHDHVSTEELHRLVKQEDGTIGYTTVYRSLKLFTDCGLASEVAFRDGVMRYEHRLGRRYHHHMLCTGCGASVEFFAPEIEQMEACLAMQHGYQITGHSLQVYGLCPECQKNRPS